MIDERIISIAEIEGSLFEYASKKKTCGSSFFIKQFLYSSLAMRMSNVNFLYESSDVPYLYDELSKEKKLNMGKDIYAEPIMYWIGYLIAVIVHVKKIAPSQIYRIIKPKELFISYEAYHSLDIVDAANRIVESRMEIEKNNLEIFKQTR